MGLYDIVRWSVLFVCMCGVGFLVCCWDVLRSDVC